MKSNIGQTFVFYIGFYVKVLKLQLNADELS